MPIFANLLILSLLFHSLAYAENDTLISYLNEHYQDINGLIALINPKTGKDIAVIDPQGLISHRLPPGSLIKPFLAIRALEDKRWRQDTVVYCGKNSCWYLAGHRQLNLTQAISHSCNRYFQEVAKGVNYERFLETIQEFGLITEKKTGLFLAAKDRLNLMVGLGNNLLVDPLSILYAYTSIFNGGYLFSSEGKVKRRVTLSEDTVKILKKGMRDSAIYGTSHLAGQQVGIEEIFGKTGTAPYCLNSDYDLTKTHAWFIGFYPVHKPIVAVLVFKAEGTGSKDAAKIGGEV
ncbi:MAG: penicillin-binding transpeptidase domain-containing protein, partial [Candidatus Desantisbacteria bacterium]